MILKALLLVVLLSGTCAFAAEYHVSPTGDDAADGSAAAPFRTLARASRQLQPGDSCILHAGTYHETLKPAVSGEKDKPITYRSAPGETVTISGADPVPGTWNTTGRLATIPLASPVEQLFDAGQMMPEARWPNCKPGQLMDYPRAEAGPGTGYDVLADTKLPPGNHTGGIVLIWNGARWWSSTRRIAAYTPGKELRFDKTYRPTKPDEYHKEDPYQPKAGNPYVIYGALSALDAPGEWFHDSKANLLHYLPAAPGKLDGVQVRRRTIGVDLSGLSHIQIRGIQFFAAAPVLKDSTSCTIEDCHFRYVEHFRELASAATATQVVTGKDNEFRKCSFGYAAGSALRVAGENNRVIDCVIFDTDYIGAIDGALAMGDSVGATVSRCTILRTGRDGIMHGNSRRITLTYNDISNVDLLNSDSGGIYSWGTDGTGSLIAYNHVHDNTGDMNVGVYIDNFCKGFTVHHNLCWNNTGAGITLNSDAENHLVANNTLAHNGKNFATFAYAGKTLTQKGTRIINNLVTGRMQVDDPWSFAQGNLAPVLKNNGKGAIDDRGVPLSGSTAIDAGIPVPPITGGFTGKAPDLGAYESGKEPWKAGATWSPPDMPQGQRTSIAFTPLPPITEQTMMRDGLILWLDAADAKTLSKSPNGAIIRWTDKSAANHHALPTDPKARPLVRPTALNGLPAVAGSKGALRIASPPAANTRLSVIIVASAPQTPEPWQRLIAAWTGTDKDWIAPSWILMIPSAEKPKPFAPQVFTLRHSEPHTLKNLTLFGTPMGPHHNFTGHISEVMVFNRFLKDDEEEAIQSYLTRKWRLRP